jgi:hypothetical protein
MIAVLNGEVINIETEERYPVQLAKPGTTWLGEALTSDELSDDLFIELLLNGVIARRRDAERNDTL